MRTLKKSLFVMLILISIFCLFSCENLLSAFIAQQEDKDASSDAALKTLSVSVGNMFPIFSVENQAYYVLLKNDQDSVRVTAAVNDPYATLMIGGQLVTSDVPSSSINLVPGYNPIPIKVIASNGTTSNTYNIYVTRATVDLPTTGQTASYAEGDDGDLEQGVSRPITRFVIDSGTITDSLTGLMWEQAPTVSLMNLTESLAYADDLVLNFHNDWRVPNRHEMRSLFNYQTEATGDWLTDKGFVGIRNYAYWTSTACRPNYFRVWALFLLDWAGGIDIYPTSDNLPVIAVRNHSSPGAIILQRTGQTVTYNDYDDGYYQAGAAWPTPRFTDNGNGTVTDNLTALMWEKTPTGTTRNWNNAVSYAYDLTLAGFEDWHLANVNELESLFNAGVDDLPAWFESEGFGTMPNPDGYFWTSTTFAPDNSYAWSRYMDPALYSGMLWFRAKTSTTTYRAWAVRSGR